MLISILILSVFTVAAGVMLFTTPADAPGVPTDDPSINNPEDDINTLPGIEPDYTPPPTEDPIETPPPLTLEALQIWIPRDRRVTDFSLSPRWGLEIQLAAVLDPPGVDIPVTWESSNEEVLVLTEVVGGIKVTAVGNGSAHIILRAGDMEDRCVVHVSGIS